MLFYSKRRACESIDCMTCCAIRCLFRLYKLTVVIVIMTGGTLIKYEGFGHPVFMAFPAVHSLMFPFQGKICPGMLRCGEVFDCTEGLL